MVTLSTRKIFEKKNWPNFAHFKSEIISARHICKIKVLSEKKYTNNHESLISNMM